MNRWLRVVLPGWPLALGAVAMVQLVFCAPFLWVMWRLAVPVGEQAAKSAFVPVMFATVGYGLFRCLMFHPLLRPGYSEWLQRVPWSSRRPLPFGPVHLVVQDVVVVGVLTAMVAWPMEVFGAAVPFEAVPQVFAFVYLLAMCMALRGTGNWAFSYLILFALGGLALLAKHPVAYFTTAAVTYGFTLLGLKRSLAAFPWLATERLQSLVKNNEPLNVNEAFASVTGEVQGAKAEKVGLPFFQLSPREPGETPWYDSTLGSALGGWYLAVLLQWGINEPGVIATAHPGVLMFACFAAGARLIRYLNGYAPPLSLLGRLGTGRLIIPAYDQVFVAPLLAMVVAGAAYVLSGLPLRAAAPVLAWLHAPQWTAPITFALVALIIASGRPSLRHWRLCGGHRHWHGTAAVQLVKTG